MEMRLLRLGYIAHIVLRLVHACVATFSLRMMALKKPGMVKNATSSTLPSTLVEVILAVTVTIQKPPVYLCQAIQQPLLLLTQQNQLGMKATWS